MPTYSYKCSCGETFGVNVERSACTAPQPCTCGLLARRVVGQVAFLQKGDNWIGKNMKIKGQMAEKNRRLSEKGRAKLKEAPGVTLVPNVGGERVDSWDEAKRLAASKGHDTSAYDSKIQQEKSA